MARAPLNLSARVAMSSIYICEQCVLYTQARGGLQVGGINDVVTVVTHLTHTCQ